MTKKTDTNKQIHFILQAKGGVGKSVVATFFAQYMAEKFPDDVQCVDTDPNNPTFSKFKTLGVKHLDLLDGPNKINERIFDKLIEQILDSKKHFVIDNGSSGFLAISNYILENQIASVLSDHKVVVHVPITGGQAFTETARGLVNIAEQFDKEIQLAVWINPYFGPLEKPLQDYNFYSKVQGRICSQIIIPIKNPETFGEDVKIMLTENYTFSDVESKQLYNRMIRNRLNIFKTDLFKHIESAGF